MVITPRPAIIPEKATAPLPALSTGSPTAPPRSTPRCPDAHWLRGCSNRRRTAGRGDNGQPKTARGVTLVVPGGDEPVPEGASVLVPPDPVTRAGAADLRCADPGCSAPAGEGRASDAGTVVAETDTAAADRAKAAMRVADAAGTRGRMGPTLPLDAGTSRG